MYKNIISFVNFPFFSVIVWLPQINMPSSIWNTPKDILNIKCTLRKYAQSLTQNKLMGLYNKSFSIEPSLEPSESIWFMLISDEFGRNKVKRSRVNLDELWMNSDLPNSNRLTVLIHISISGNWFCMNSIKNWPKVSQRTRVNFGWIWAKLGIYKLVNSDELWMNSNP